MRGRAFSGGGLSGLPPRLVAALAAAAVMLSALPEARAEALIVVAGPASGARASETQAILAAVQRAADTINRDGGLRGEPVAVALEDDGCSGASAADTAKRIVARAPALVVGHACSNAAIAAAREYGPAKIILITPGARHREVTERRAGPTIFRLAGRDDRQGAFIGEWLARASGGRRIALVSDRTVYAQRLVEDARAVLVRAAATPPPLVASIVAGEKDYAGLIAQLKSGGIETLFFAGFATEAAIVLRQVRAAGLRLTIIASDAVATDEFLSLAAGAADGVLLAVPALDGVAARAGAAVEAWRAAVLTAGSRAPEAVAAAMSAGALATASLGVVRFSAKGDADVAAFAMLTCRDVPERTLAAACK